MKIPTILGIVLLASGLVAGVLLVSRPQKPRISASLTTTPTDVRITNVTDSSFTVSWHTSDRALGFVSWGKNSSLGMVSTEKEPKNLHYVTINTLSPSTSYFFNLGVGEDEYGKNGVPYSIKTGPKVSAQIKDGVRDMVVFGKVLNSNGNGSEDSVIYITFKNGAPLSIQTDNSGGWVINLNQARSTSLGLISVNSDTVLEVLAKSQEGSTTSAKIKLGGAKPVPDMILGKSYNFVSLEVASSQDTPSSNLEIPLQSAQAAPTPGFSLGPVNTTKPVKSPTPTPTRTVPTPTLKPSPTPTRAPTATPTPVASEKPISIPIAGGLTLTFTNLIMGFISLAIGILIQKLFKI